MDWDHLHRSGLNPGAPARGMTRRAFSVSFGAGMGMLAMPTWSNAAAKKVPMSTGIDALFAEVHEDPDRALCDGPCALKPEMLEDLLKDVLAIRRALQAS